MGFQMADSKAVHWADPMVGNSARMWAVRTVPSKAGPRALHSAEQTAWQLVQMLAERWGVRKAGY